MAEGVPGSGDEVVLYTTDDGLAKVQLRALDGTAWLTQAQIAELFQVTPQAVTQHIRAVYAEAELTEEATCNDYLQVRFEGLREISSNLRHYRLEAVLAVGKLSMSARCCLTPERSAGQRLRREPSKSMTSSTPGAWNGRNRPLPLILRMS